MLQLNVHTLFRSATVVHVNREKQRDSAICWVLTWERTVVHENRVWKRRDSASCWHGNALHLHLQKFRSAAALLFHSQRRSCFVCARKPGVLPRPNFALFLEATGGLRKINRIFLKHWCLFLRKRCLIKRLLCTNKHRCLNKAWFIFLSISPKHPALYKASSRSIETMKPNLQFATLRRNQTMEMMEVLIRQQFWWRAALLKSANENGS